MESQQESSDLLRLFETISVDVNIIADAFEKLLQSYICTAKSFEETRKKWQRCVKENDELSSQLHNAHSQITNFEQQLQTARKLIDKEKRKTKEALTQRDHFEQQLNLLREILKSDKYLPEETKSKLSLIQEEPCREEQGDHLDTIAEIETTSDLLEDYTKEEEDFLNDSTPDVRPTKRQYFNDENVKPPKKKRKSSKTVKARTSETVVATTTVTVQHNGPISATSVLETFSNTPEMNRRSPETPVTVKKTESEESLETQVYRTPSNDMLPSTPFSMNSINTRPHKFMQKAMIRGEYCNVCNKRLKFSALGSKCRDCKTICHNMCKDKVPLPCVTAGDTPNKNNGPGTIADYTPKRGGPMIPALIVHCIKEIETRGMNELGLYRIPGSDKEVKALKEKFLKGKGIPNLSQISDINTICGCLKDFLRSLKEPIITLVRWDLFAAAAEIKDVEDRRARLIQIVSELPRPNRDTLAFLILHLQRVAEVPECKMPVANLAKMFGPSVVGYSKNEPENIFAETHRGNKVMSELISTPAEYWEGFIKEEQPCENDMQKTPSTNSLLNFFQTTPVTQRSNRTLRKIRYFESP